MAALRVAIVGAGLMGRWHARYAARAGGRVVAVVDRDEPAAAALCRRHPGAAPFGGLGACLAGAAVEAVHVCTPLAGHVLLAEEALLAGKHVLVEKPLTATAGEARRLLDLAGRRGLRLGVVHQFPFQEGFRRVCRAAGRFGGLVRVSFRTCTAGAEGRDPAERRRVLREIAPHPVSLFRALRGPGAAPLGWVVHEYTSEELSFSGSDQGVRFEALISLRGRPTRNELLVLGSRASALVDLYHGYAVIETGEAGRLTKLLRPFRLGAGLLARAGLNLARRAWAGEPAYPGLRALIGAFYDSVRGRGPAPVGDAEILEAAELFERLAAG